MSIDTSVILDQVPTGLFIDGRFAQTETSFEVKNPATGQIIATVSDASAHHATTALDAACKAGPAWATTAPRDRAEILRRAFDLIIERRSTFATLMTLEMGKPVTEALGEVSYGAEFLRWFAEETCRINGRWGHSPTTDSRILTMKQPVGPVYAITPWNFPLAMATRKIAPALAAGCTVVAKPSQLTPLTMLYLMLTFKDAGVPDGVINCVTSSDASSISRPIIADPRLRKLTFTGSTGVGIQLLEDAAASVLRTSMELGGNAPFLVLSDADIDAAVAGAMIAKYRNNGEACTAANRFLVHTDVYDEFRDKFVVASKKLVTGNGLDDSTTLGPLINAAAVHKITELVDDAVEQGATILTGGTPLDGPGHFYPPTVLTEVPTTARLQHEEVFGPVAPLVRVGSDDEAIKIANATEFGLMAYVYSRDIGRALGTVERLESGMVALNTGHISNAAAPFGGVKHSGLGREGSHEGIEEYLETKYVGIDAL